MRDDDNLLDLIRNRMGGKCVTIQEKTLAISESQSIQKVRDISQPRKNPTQVIDDYTLSLRADIIADKKTTLSSNADFEKLDELLSEIQTLNYAQFLEYSLRTSPPARRFFTAQYFLMFPKDGLGAISSEKFLRYARTACYQHLE